MAAMVRPIILLLAILNITFVILILREAPLFDTREAVYERMVEEACPSKNDHRVCVENLLVKTIAENGLSEGFQMLRAHYLANVKFRSGCHPAALNAGTALGKTQRDYLKFSYSPESTWCNFGFYQGYPEGLLISGASIGYARKFCEYVGVKLGEEVPAARAECFRGIGRALPFLKKELWGDATRMASYATETCEAIAPEGDPYQYCILGVFNHIARKKMAQEYGLSVNTRNPFELCDDQPKNLEKECRAGMQWAAFSLVTSSGDFAARLQDALSIFDTAPTSSVFDVIWTLGYEEGRGVVAGNDTDENAVRACAILPADLQTRCIQGIVIGLVKHGIPDKQHEHVNEFCAKAIATMHALKKEDCSGPAIRFLRGLRSPMKFEKVCDEFDGRLGVTCE